MKLYYKAINEDGKPLEGFFEAKSPQEGAVILRRQRLFPVKIVERKDVNLFGSLTKTQSLSAKDRIFFTRQLSIMINSGLTLMQALTILRDEVEKKQVKDMLNGIIADVESGSSLSGALSKYPKGFSSIYISLIKAAESSGLMDKVLDRMAETLEKQQALKEKIRGALVYPVIVIFLMLGVAVLMMVMVIPQISTLYESFDVELPLPTKLLILASDITIQFWPILIILFIGAVIGFMRLRKTKTGRALIDKYILKIPIVGKLMSENILTEFSRTLSLLVGAGSSIVPSLRMVENVAGNSLYEKAIAQAAYRVEKGVTVGDALGAEKLFPPYLVQMIKIGEESGKLDESLLRTSAYYEAEVERVVKTLTTAMEPLIIVVLGIGVGFLLISVITPIYQLTSAF